MALFFLKNEKNVYRPLIMTLPHLPHHENL